ncbi:hypothetical protein BCT62_23845 [Vibrio splendidus]|nr:hypothetical protein BCT62_23845 [Vibrio splendidus]PMN21161.1 hypothetical protein BCT36_18345 [Vibrio splendidus]
MRVIFKKTEGDYLEATIEVDGVKVVAMDEFGGDRYQAGENIDIRLSVGLALSGIWCRDRHRS